MQPVRYEGCKLSVHIRKIIDLSSTLGICTKVQPHAERPIPPKIYPVIDNDLARDNVENDLPAADLQELQ